MASDDDQDFFLPSHRALHNCVGSAAFSCRESRCWGRASGAPRSAADSVGAGAGRRDRRFQLPTVSVLVPGVGSAAFSCRESRWWGRASGASRSAVESLGVGVGCRERTCVWIFALRSAFLWARKTHRHVKYFLGFVRVSCAHCVFMSPFFQLMKIIKTQICFCSYLTFQSAVSMKKNTWYIFILHEAVFILLD